MDQMNSEMFLLSTGLTRSFGDVRITPHSLHGADRNLDILFVVYYAIQ